MKLSILEKFKDIKQSRTTYNFGILQTKAYKALKGTTTELLKPFNLATTDWAVLGLLYENPKGLRLIEIADLLGVEAPFITALADNLEKKSLIERTTSLEDKRSKYLVLSEAGKKTVKEVEQYLQKNTKFLIEGISFKDILAYRRVLIKITENQQNHKKI